MCKWQGHLIRWLCGGVLYGLLETFWRGHTHWTMMVLAAVLRVPLDVANEYFPWELPLTVQAVLGGLAITAGELLAGLCSMSGWGWVSGTTRASGGTSGAKSARCTQGCGACWPGR